MTSTGIIAWIKSCSGMILEGDGAVCMANGEPINVLLLILIIIFIVYMINKTRKEKKIDKSFGSFVGQ